MRNLKKFLALALAMVMAFSLMLTVNAKDVVTEFGDRDQVTAEFKEAVDVLSGMKVFQGDEGGFRPGDTITRAEVAAIIYRMATGDTGTEKMDLYTTTHPFTDVSANDWFAGYVGYCWNAGYIKGTTATTFNPYDNVTGYEVLAMILRAMGYDANNEFTGNQWIVNVSATAQQRGLLADVKTTHYGNTLHLASRRDVVASILFQAAQKTRVKYTPAFGYQSGDFTSNTPEDPNNYNEYTPLGRMNFGLTSTYRMVLGNQATGEKSTVLGVRVENNSDSVNDGQKANTATVNADRDGDTTKTVDISYAYPGSIVGEIGKDAAKKPVTFTGTLKVNAKTGLDLFGHKVKVWYDYRDQNSDGIRDNAYAILDKSSLAALVHTTSEDEHSAKLSVATNAEKNNAKLGIAAQKAGFKVDLTDSDAYISDNFSRIQGVSEDALAAAAGNRVGNFAPTEDIILGSVNDMYVLISNNSDKKVDVVIPVSADVARITRKDTVSSVKTLTLGCGDNGIFSRFDVDATVEDGKITDITAGDDGIIAADSVVDGSTTTLGDKVAAWMVLGTNNKALYTDDRKDTLGNKGTYSNDNPGNVMYYLDKLEQTKTGTVRTFGADKSITLTDGTVIERSWFRYKFDEENFADGKAYGDKTDSDFVVGKDGTSNEPFVYPDAFEVGKTYTVALDNEGRWLGVTSEASSFIYATFGDYQIGDLGTGTIKYTVTGINWNGEKVINSEVKAINMGVDAEWDDDAISNLRSYAWNVIPKNYLHFPNTTHDYALGVGYNLLPFTKKDLGNGSLVITGNQIQAGQNTGTMLSSDGTLDVSTLVSDVNAQPVSTHNVDGERISSLSESNPNQWAKWGVDEDDVKNGFVDVYGDGMCLLTNDTKFIVVSGTGSATLDAKVYNGLAEFLGDNQSVRLETRYDDDDGELYKHVSYIKTDIDQYNRVDGQQGTNQNRKVTHVIMSKDDLTYTSGSSLYFAAPLSKAAGTGVKLAGTDPDEVKQFELWNDGEKGTYFVDLTLTDHDGDGDEENGLPYTEDTAEETTGRFIQLAPDREVNGVTVYRAKAVDHGSYKVPGTVGDVGLIFWYTGNNNMATATVEKPGDGKYREVLNVTGAKVVDVKYNSVTCDHDEINSMALLNAIVSGDMSRYNGVDTIQVAVAHDGVNVPVIYVTHVPECPTKTGHNTPD